MKKAIIIALFLIIAVSTLAYAAEAKNSDLEKVTFVHHKKGLDKRELAATTDTATTSSSTCYNLLGIKWPSLPVSYVINPSNKEGLSSSFVKYSVSKAAETWDYSTSKELFNNKYSTNYSVKYGVQDFKNSIVFSSYPSTSIIATTAIWYSKSTKNIVEFDMLFNSYFIWGNATANSSLMDLQNIAMHEFGHSIGLGDIYNTCTRETMYGYSKAGETFKRSLNPGDIAGLRSIYG